MKSRFAPSLCVVLLYCVCPVGARAADLQGSVVGPNRDPLPRATVRLLDSAGSEITRALTDEAGRFLFRGVNVATAGVEVSLTGFETKTTAVTPGSELEVILPLAPLHESVVVTATRTEVPSGQLATTTSVIAEEEIHRRLAVPASDLLRTVPGLAVVRVGGVGVVTSVFIRGGQSNHNKVLLDGVPLNEPGGAFDFSNLSAENLERIEVVRGPESALFGSDAMAGTIQLFTRRGKSDTRQPHVTLSGEGGKYRTWRARSAVFGQIGAFDYSLDWARFSTDNQDPNGFFHNTSVSGNFGLNMPRRTSLRLILRGELGRAGTPGNTAFGRPDLDSFFRRRDGYGSLTLRNQTTAFWNQRLTYSLGRSRQVSRDLGTDLPFTPTFEGRTAAFQSFDFAFDFLDDTRRHHLSYQSDWQAGSVAHGLGQHLLTFAFDWDGELGELGDRFSRSPFTHPRRDNFGWTLQHQAIWGRLFLTNGARAEDNNSFGTTVVPRSSIAYLLRRGSGLIGATKAKFNFGLGIKEPTFLESFSSNPFFLGNPDLAPERVRSFDFGVEQRFWNDRAKLEVNGFDNRFRDLIAFRTVSFNPFRGSFFNIGRSKAKGAEVIAELVPVRRLHAVASYTFLDSQITQRGAPNEGQPLLRRPRHSGSLQIFWDWRQFDISSTTIYVGRRADNDFVGLRPPLTSSRAYTRWDLTASFHSRYHMTYFAVLENLLNQKYMEAPGFPALRLTYRAGARVEF